MMRVKINNFNFYMTIVGVLFQNIWILNTVKYQRFLKSDFDWFLTKWQPFGQNLNHLTLELGSSIQKVLISPHCIKIYFTCSYLYFEQFFNFVFLQVRNPAFNRVVQRLKDRESLENLVAACPDLAKVQLQ